MTPPPLLPPGRLRIGIVGVGKVGAVLGAALARTGHLIVAASAVSEQSLARAAALLPDTPIAAPDDVVAPAIDQGVGCMAIHPAMSFTGTEMDLQRLRDCCFGVTAPPDLVAVAQALVVEMGGEPVLIDEFDRVRYHLGLVHGSNYCITLVAQAMEILRGAGVGDPGRVLRPLMNAALDNALRAGDAALTGPVARGDAGTVAEHFHVLRDEEPDVQQVYRVLAAATLARARRQGRLGAVAAGALADVLADQEDPT